jgi:putative flavoprotein involved in K+ transport
VPTRYRNPGELPEGAVLVVGASASGVQLADEIHASGRPVTLAVGRHMRLPRRYRGRDILCGSTMGLFDETGTRSSTSDLQLPAVAPARGAADHATLDLPLLERPGVLVGRALRANGATISFAYDLVAHTAAADVKLAQLLARIDAFVASAGLASEVGPAEPFEPFLWPAPAPEAIDLRAEGIRTVVWATGFRRHYPWLKVPVVDERGELRHDRGITPAPGLYALGLSFQRRRKSTFIDGVGDDARELADHIATRGNDWRRAVA